MLSPCGITRKRQVVAKFPALEVFGKVPLCGLSDSNVPLSKVYRFNDCFPPALGDLVEAVKALSARVKKAEARRFFRIRQELQKKDPHAVSH